MTNSHQKYFDGCLISYAVCSKHVLPLPHYLHFLFAALNRIFRTVQLFIIESSGCIFFVGIYSFCVFTLCLEHNGKLILNALSINSRNGQGSIQQVG